MCALGHLLSIAALIEFPVVFNCSCSGYIKFLCMYGFFTTCAVGSFHNTIWDYCSYCISSESHL